MLRATGEDHLTLNKKIISAKKNNKKQNNNITLKDVSKHQYPKKKDM